MTHLEPRRTDRSMATALLVAARPKQWAKNLLVFVAPAAAGVLSDPDPFLQTVVAFLAFCAAASGTYYLNDAADVEADRRHPVKRYRPVASGEMPVPLARALGAGLLAVGLLIAASRNMELLAVVAGYVALTTTYSYWLKHLAVIDLVVIASGFMLRATGGAVATEVPISDWFFIVASAVSVFVVGGKRLAELRTAGEDASDVRSTLGSYSTAYLGFVLAASGGIAILSYCLWAFEEAELLTSGAIWLQLSIIPFVTGVLRYALLIDAGGGGEPEELVLHDRTLQVVGLLWIVLFAVGIYGQ